MVSPLPGELEGQEECYDLREIGGTGKYQGGYPKHLKEHGKEENQKAIAKALAFHPMRDVMLAT